jgi:stage III sporulation protein SpoIIIAA
MKWRNGSIIDTSNEIAGDSDIPHSGIGRARRMQVAKPTTTSK